MRRGSAAPTRTPMACCASTYPRAPTCRCSRKPNSTPSPPGSTAGRARRLALRHPMRCSPRWWTRPPTPSRHEMRRVFVMELESAEDIYLRAYATGSEARLGIGRWIAGYNTTRPHQALGYRTPDEVYRSPPVAGLAPTPIDVAA